jgi:arylsulfatase A-like enzyme
MSHAPQISRRNFLRHGAAAGALLSANACRSGTPATFPKASRVIFVTIDTLRADHVGCYGYPRPTTPFLDVLSKDGIQFEQTYASSSHTLPSHTAMFTGLDMPQHKVYTNRQAALAPQVWSMAELFQLEKYDTAAFVAGGFLRVLKRGFNTFTTPPPDTVDYPQADALVDQAIDWLKSKKVDDPVFLWLHFFEPHLPYRAPRVYQDRMADAYTADRERLFRYWTQTQHKSTATLPWDGVRDPFVESNNQYDAEIAFVDHELGRLHEYVAGTAPGVETLWMVTADHGEGLGNHNYSEHSKLLYQEQLHVPMIFNFSSGAYRGIRFPHMARHVDLLPTMAEMLGVGDVPQAVPIYGRSLCPFLRGNVAPPVRFAFAQRRHKRPQDLWTSDWSDDDVYCIIDPRRKYIHQSAGPAESFDLRSDPHELDSQYNETNAKAQLLRTQAVALFEEMSASAADIPEIGVTEENNEELEALGYV